MFSPGTTARKESILERTYERRGARGHRQRVR